MTAVLPARPAAAASARPLPRLIGAELEVPLVTGDRVRYANLDLAASAPALAGVADHVTELLPFYASVHRGAGYASQVCTTVLEQAREFGDLPGPIAARLDRIAPGKERGAAPTMQSGGRLLRQWNGTTHIVDVVPNGFVWNGGNHRSLSAIARAITGTRWSGPRFFGLRKPPATPADATGAAHE